MTTTYGSILFAEHVPGSTAEAVRRLVDRAWVCVGKTNLHEFAYGISSQNPHFGTVPNPRAPGRLAGGSSGGNGAALAADLVDLALGTDSGGSIRIPAAWCGVVGFKPTWGLVSLEGCFPLASSFDHAGPMAQTVNTCVQAMQALVPGFDALSVDSVEDVRVGIAWTENADPLVRKRVEGVAERFARRVDLRLPTPEEIYEATYKQFMQEVATVHRELFDEYADAYGENVRLKIERCLRITDSEADAARASRDEIRERFFEATRDVDLLLTPTVPFVAPPSDADEIAFRKRGISLTYPFNCLGWPALALPCGAAESGLPSSAQLVGKPDDDALVLGVGASLVRGTAAA